MRSSKTKKSKKFYVYPTSKGIKVSRRLPFFWRFRNCCILDAYNPKHPEKTVESILNYYNFCILIKMREENDDEAALNVIRKAFDDYFKAGNIGLLHYCFFKYRMKNILSFIESKDYIIFVDGFYNAFSGIRVSKANAVIAMKTQTRFYNVLTTHYSGRWYIDRFLAGNENVCIQQMPLDDNYENFKEAFPEFYLKTYTGSDMRKLAKATLFMKEHPTSYSMHFLNMLEKELDNDVLNDLIGTQLLLELEEKV